MQSSELVEGRSYAPHRGRSGPPEKVTLVAKVGRRGHIKIRYEGGIIPDSRSTSTPGSLSSRGVK